MTDDNIIELGMPEGMTARDIAPEKALKAAINAGLGQVFILGRLPNGELYAANSDPDPRGAIYDFEEWKHELLSGSYDP